METSFDVIVIGSGAAGLSAAYGAASQGATVALAERSQYLGGECPNSACIPTQALLRVAKVYSLLQHADQFGLEVGSTTFNYQQIAAHKDHIVAQTAGRNLTASKLADAGITLIRGEARFADIHTLIINGTRYTGRQFVIATGSRPQILPIEGLSQTPYLTYRDMLALKAVPESLVILGGGPVGAEFAQLMAIFGCDVTLLEHCPQLLPQEDVEAAALIEQQLRGFGVDVHTNFSAEHISGGPNTITVRGKSKNTPMSFNAASLLVATGTLPNIDSLNLDRIGVTADHSGIATDDTLRTTVPHIWAVGDVTRLPHFTHTAHYEGSIVAHNLTHQEKRRIDLRIIPRALATIPDIASVGKTEAELTQARRPILVGRAQIETLGRALIDQEQTGFVKLLADASTGQIMGCTIASPHAAEMIHEVAVAMKAALPVQQLVELVHAYPTYAEAIAIAAADAASQLPE